MISKILKRIESVLSKTAVKLSYLEAIDINKSLERLNAYQSLGSIEDFQQLITDKTEKRLDCLEYGKFFEDFHSKLSNELSNIINRLIGSNANIYVTFKFDWNNHKSWVVVTGGENGEKFEIITPQIPLIGGCWSDHVAKRMAVGQVLVSAMLESVAIQLEFHAYNKGYNIKIHKIDKCFYGPLLYYSKDENGKAADNLNNCIGEHREYLPLLTQNNPEAYKYVLMYPDGRDYWKLYHDK